MLLYHFLLLLVGKHSQLLLKMESIYCLKNISTSLPALDLIAHGIRWSKECHMELGVLCLCICLQITHVKVSGMKLYMYQETVDPDSDFKSNQNFIAMTSLMCNQHKQSLNFNLYPRWLRHLIGLVNLHSSEYVSSPPFRPNMLINSANSRHFLCQS